MARALATCSLTSFKRIYFGAIARGKGARLEFWKVCIFGARWSWFSSDGLRQYITLEQHASVLSGCAWAFGRGSLRCHTLNSLLQYKSH